MRRNDVIAYAEVLLWGAVIIAFPVLLIAIVFTMATTPIGTALAVVLSGIIMGGLLGLAIKSAWPCYLMGILIVIAAPAITLVKPSNLWPMAFLLSIGISSLFVVGLLVGQAGTSSRKE